MKGSPAIIAALNERLVEEHTAVQQYTAHRAIMQNWGYAGFASYIQERIDDETKHFNLLLDRITLLGGLPVSGLNPVSTSDIVDTMLAFDGASEQDAIAKYNETIQLCVDEGDNDTRRLLEEILKDEVEHLHDIEANLTQLAQMGLQNYLSLQVKG